ncbi:hypothetical protein B9Y66_06325 [Stenotrophomonas maltophilia]|nr:hypothetical protein B9Y66_06325 [Stenotrophomonas maltophilia]
MPPPLLLEVLNARESRVAPGLNWSEADRALLAGQFEAAASLYAEAEDSSDNERAKHGFCLGMQGEDDAAEKLLNESNVGPHPEAQALLAWVLGGTSGCRMRGLVSTQGTAEKPSRKDRVEALFKQALSQEVPSVRVFNSMFYVLGDTNKDVSQQAARARLLYPNWAWPHAIVACSQRMAGETDPAILGDLIRTLSEANQQLVFQEAYVHAIRLRMWDDADRVVEALTKLVGRDEQAGSGNLVSLAELRAMVSLHRARAGDLDAYGDVLTQVAPFLEPLQSRPHDWDPTVAPKFQMQVALETGRNDMVQTAVAILLERIWSSHDHSAGDLDAWSPFIATPSLVGVIHFGHFGFDLISRSRDVEAQLDGILRDRWSLIFAADAVLNSTPEADQVALLCATPVLHMPWWICRAILEAHTNYASKWHSAGELLAELAERATGMPSPEDDRLPLPLDNLGIYVELLDDPLAVFEGSLSWLSENPSATGETLIVKWGQELAEVDGGKAVLSRLATLSLSRSDSTEVRKMKALAETAETPEDQLAATIAMYPTPEATRVRAEQLTLLEAASLVALLRACPLDHIRWTLAPLTESSQSFEPTRKFIGALFGLLQKGVLAIDTSTPTGVVDLDDNGRLRAYLEKVIWRASPNTLALHREIRDLPRRDWPAGWRDCAWTLARDIGVEELATYLEYLIEERRLPTPDLDEARMLFRVQLEQLSIAQCYYLAHKTMREALDYVARYRPGRSQIETRIINLLRGNGDRAIEQGWDTRHSRIRDLPPSLLWESLNDVLTGWGQSAFEEPMATLQLEQTGGTTAIP